MTDPSVWEAVIPTTFISYITLSERTNIKRKMRSVEFYNTHPVHRPKKSDRSVVEYVLVFLLNFLYGQKVLYMQNSRQDKYISLYCLRSP